MLIINSLIPLLSLKKYQKVITRLVYSQFLVLVKIFEGFTKLEDFSFNIKIFGNFGHQKQLNFSTDPLPYSNLDSPGLT